jgi:hypothetical protein
MNCRQAGIDREVGAWRMAVGGDMDWSEMEGSQPRLAGLGRRRLLVITAAPMAVPRGPRLP